MARDDREFLEGIAVDMVIGSMEYMEPEAETEAWEQVKELNDAELIAWICDR